MSAANTTPISAGMDPDPAVREKGSGPIKVPWTAPTSQSRPKPRPALTADQQSKYDWLVSQAKAWTSVPARAKGKTNADTGPLQDSEKEWLTRECFLRFLRAAKWNQKDAEKRLLETLAWRRDYGVESLTPEQISHENETGKQILLGFDKEGRPCHYMSPSRQNTDPSPRQVQHLVFMLERAIDLMPPGQETLALLISFKTGKNTPGIGLAREVLNILQDHYPERLGKALIINVPWMLWGFFKLITPLIDPMTREKLKFNEDLKQYVPAEQLWTEFNGELAFDYEHSVYWPFLQKLCSERRTERHKRWLAGGQQLGELEDFLAGTADVGVAGAPADVEKTQNAMAEVHFRDMADKETAARAHDAMAESDVKQTAVDEITAKTEAVRIGELETKAAPSGGEKVEAAEHEASKADVTGTQDPQQQKEEAVKQEPAEADNNGPQAAEHEKEETFEHGIAL